MYVASPETEFVFGVAPCLSSFPWLFFALVVVLAQRSSWLKPDQLWSEPPAGAKPCDARRAERLGRAEGGGPDQSVAMGPTRFVFLFFPSKTNLMRTRQRVRSLHTTSLRGGSSERLQVGFDAGIALALSGGAA